MKNIIKNVLIFISYFIYEYVFIALLSCFNIDYYSFSYSNKVLTLFIFYLIYIGFIIVMYKDEIKKDFIDFKNNYKQYLSKYLWVYLVGILLMGISNMIIQSITNLELSGNEENVRLLIKKIPLFMMFSSVIYAPFIEEIIFRKSIKNIINKKYLFIIISGFLFGVLHISDYTNINEILMGIPYMIMGIDFAYIYYKTNNIFTTMTFHLCHNLVLLIIQLL